MNRAMAPPRGGRLPSRVLLVEDNAMIALDTEDTLLAFGVERVDVAASTAAALAAIAAREPDFALLDYNLGDETSEPVARTLEARAIPFAFASGYGEVKAMARGFAHALGVLLKPYAMADLRSVLIRSLAAAGAAENAR